MTALQPFWITQYSPPDAFPDAEFALREPNGLLAAGGDLSPRRLLCAYRRGIFPWYSDGQPILWWSPNPRAVIRRDTLHVPRSLRKRLRRGAYRVTVDAAFPRVVRACAAPRDGQMGTWITAEMADAYLRLHHLGHARSIECWVEGDLVGGLYGVSIGRVFFGESMFSRAADASKVALVHLVHELGYELVDCQLPSPHLTRLGAVEIPRSEFLGALDRLCPLAGFARTGS